MDKKDLAKQNFYDAFHEYKDKLSESKSDVAALVVIECSDHGPAVEGCGTVGAMLAGISDALVYLSKREGIPLKNIIQGIYLYKSMMDVVDAKKSLRETEEAFKADDDDDDEYDDDDIETETIVLSGDAVEEAKILVDKLRKLNERNKKCLN